MHRGTSKLPFTTRLTLSLAVAVAACRSEVNATRNSRGAETTPPDLVSESPTAPPVVATPSQPIEVENGIGEQRVSFQSRSVIELRVDLGLFANGNELTLANESSGKTLIESRSVIGRLTLHLSDPAVQAGFVYGENRLRLLVSNADEQQTAATTIELLDFPIMGVAASAFSEDAQVIDGYQAWAMWIQDPVVSVRDGAKLTTGLFNIVNE